MYGGILYSQASTVVTITVTDNKIDCYDDSTAEVDMWSILRQLDRYSEEEFEDFFGYGTNSAIYVANALKLSLKDNLI
jgi:hypothetical protein